MHTKLTVAITMTLVMAALLTVSWSALQRSQAQLENTVLSMHNQERAAVGVPPLTWSSSLAAQAQAYANTLASRGYVCTFERCDILPHGASNENLAWGSTNYPLVFF